MDLLKINKSDALYSQMDDLRREVIWVPFNLTTSGNFEDEEARSISFAFVNNNKMLACATITPSADNTSIRARLVAVYPSHQGKGLGKKLMQICEEEAIKMGFKELGLFAHTGSHEFYVKLGYVYAGEWKSHPNGLGMVFMKKALTD